ncbi:hypothetical protein Hlac_2146 [Halorubrum lacusprofundi ATCC 49239]|uniref:Uncharacterized protein n=2 Tax=Halorubrum lacusprofundi TaxID=2247 RepID=B9LR69_HALLT|nr:hypothetical protein Hlac_2146 [Halorubrum lacusprofundi ATCC 49239]
MGRRVGSPPQLIFLILHNTHVEAINLPVRSRRDDDSKGYNPAAVEPVTMSDETIEAAVEHFLDETESSLDSYEQGYADADATLTVLRTHIDELAAAVDDERSE